MEKKIFSIGMVKNEADVIESFVRYNINIFDGMIILDNGSTDDTLEILKQLQKEGVPLIVLEDEDREYEQTTKMNKLLLKAVEEFNADIIVPLDADEFLISTTGENPRNIIEKIGPETFYLAKWKTYIPDLDENKSQKFIPAKITSIRDASLEGYYNVILPKELVENYNVKLTMGNHDLSYDSDIDTIKKIINNDLRIAHFPIRSKEQTISKIAVGWIYSIYRIGRTGSQCFHWKLIFDKLKENREILNEDVINFAKQFALTDDVPEINLVEDPMVLTFCSNIGIKYTPDKIHPISNLLEGCEWLSLAYLNSRKELIEEKEQLESKIEDLTQDLCDLNDLKLKEENQWKSRIEKYENSTSWSITAPLRKIGAIRKQK